MQTRALLVDAFTAEPLTGNAAGVVPDAEGLSDAQMQALARELAVSETAFVRESESADRRVRYFTPEREVDLCGHATVATHAHLHADGVLDAGRHSLETAVGLLEVEVTDEGVVWMTQDDPSVERLDVDHGEWAAALGVPQHALSEVGADLPAARASTGMPFVCLPVGYLSNLSAMDPDVDAVAALCEAHDATGVYAFTFDTLDADSVLHARTFAPGAGVPEDPVTGTASGACAAYLHRETAVEADAPWTFEQGDLLDRGGRVRVEPDPVRVGGRAATSLDGTVTVPARSDGDDIIEA